MTESWAVTACSRLLFPWSPAPPPSLTDTERGPVAVGLVFCVLCEQKLNAQGTPADTPRRRGSCCSPAAPHPGHRDSAWDRPVRSGQACGTPIPTAVPVWLPTSKLPAFLNRHSELYFPTLQTTRPPTSTEGQAFIPGLRGYAWIPSFFVSLWGSHKNSFDD